MSFVTALRHSSTDCTSGCPCKNIFFAQSIWTAAEYNNMSAMVAKVNQSISYVNKLDQYGYVPLHFAAQNGNIGIVEFLLIKGALPDGITNGGCGATPLHRAAFSGHISVCELLIKFGANINALDTSFGDSRTPLHKAASQSHFHLVDYLIKSGADVNIRDLNGLLASEILDISPTPATLPQKKEKDLRQTDNTNQVSYTVDDNLGCIPVIRTSKVTDVTTNDCNTSMTAEMVTGEDSLISTTNLLSTTNESIALPVSHSTDITSGDGGAPCDLCHRPTLSLHRRHLQFVCFSCR